MTITSLAEVQSFLDSRKLFGIKPGLTRMKGMLDKLGNPEKQLKSVHIAGTNGKGSTLIYMRDCLIKSGYKVGSFTSPHNQLTSHIHINDLSIGDLEMARLMNTLFPIVETLDAKGDNPSEFEILVVIAILYMKEANVDIALFEAGMGGREDSTNCIEPILTIITNIGLDHTKFLGQSIEEIAYHKAGIIKQNVPVIIGDMNDQAKRVIFEEAELKRASVYRYGIEFTTSHSALGQFDFCTSTVRIPLAISMRGIHQVHNASVACMALIELRKQSFQILEKNIIDSFSNASNPGRFELISENPIIILDGAHNTEGIRAFINTVNAYYPTSKKHILFAAFKDKPLKEMVTMIEEVFDDVIYTTFEHPRAATAKEIYKSSSKNTSSYICEWESSLQSLVSSNTENSIICITGSLFFIELTRDYLRGIL